MRVGFGLVRDKHGNPKFDGDVNDLHPAILMKMTDDEKSNLGVWGGPMGKDAQGTKRIEVVNGVYKAKDDIVALSEIFDGEKYYRLGQRIDVPAGGTIMEVPE